MSQPGSDARTAELFTVDVIPGHSGIKAECEFRADGTLQRLRFQANRRGGIEVSEWSGWFDYAGEPIVLTWAAFWPEDESSGRGWRRWWR